MTKSKEVAAGTSRPSPRPRSYGRIMEIISVAALTGCFFVFTLKLSTLSMVAAAAVLAVVFFVTLATALRLAVGLSRAERADAASVMYKVTKARIKTLTTAGVPADVTEALEKLAGQPPLSGRAFIDRLALGTDTDLGLERTKEFEEQILKYTKVDRNDATPPPADAPEEKAAESNGLPEERVPLGSPGKAYG
jgi:hypothetical protein